MDLTRQQFVVPASRLSEFTFEIQCLEGPNPGYNALALLSMTLHLPCERCQMCRVGRG